MEYPFRQIDFQKFNDAIPMKFYKIFLLIGICFLWKCSDNNHSIIRYDKFPLEKNLNLVQINLPDTVFMRYPAKLIKSDSLFFILDVSRATEYFVHCYSYPDFKYIRSLFRFGQGPEEYISLNNIQCTNDTLFAYDVANSIYSIDLKNIDWEKPTVKKTILTNDFGSLVRGIKIGDKFYFSTFNQFNKEKILTFDENGTFISSFGEIKLDGNREIDAATYQAWIPFMDGNEELLVTVTQFGEVLDIFHIKNNNIQQTLKGKSGDPVFQVINGYAVNQGIMGFQDVCVTNGKIYALFDGTKMKERNQEQQGGKIIYVFDYNGNPIMKVFLDRLVISFYVDEEEQKIYFLDVNSNNPFYYAKL